LIVVGENELYLIGISVRVEFNNDITLRNKSC
jgi:hypothetical protein